MSVRQRECVDALKTSADGLMALIDDMLDIAKIESRILDLERIAFDLSKLMNEVIAVMAAKAAEKNIAIHLDAAALKQPHYIGDPNRIRQILLNLCGNGLKFTQAGRIDFIIECDEASKPGMEKIIIHVRDTGIGIAPEKLQAVFQKFVQADSSITRKYGGTGLGLAITKMLAEAMGGEISVTSELGKGSQFSVVFYLPIEQRKAVRA